MYLCTMKRIISLFILGLFALEFYFINKVTQGEPKAVEAADKIATFTGQQLGIADTTIVE